MSTPPAAAGTAVASTALDTLTADPAKRDVYRYDTYAREGLRSFAEMTALRRSHDVTFVVLKPDAVAGRRCELDARRGACWCTGRRLAWWIADWLTGRVSGSRGGRAV
ncbi:hypothetical protein [Streptomyces sp. SID2888]|uniref:hypothetical protein n=1 Tax=Streptomyces sp. SID2888 TaxID=2690256 RepID=UPI00136A3C27|nr:hypothetical protein [Streptomyces sp. SID2888]MYV48353.1 hypothetical protein [Streptomyces sp. SID2888]